MEYNEGAGWDLDDGSGTRSINNATVNATNLAINWNGCYQEYPIVHTSSAIACYTQSNQGYGDGVGTPPTPLNWHCEQCSAFYNMQDAFDIGHTFQSDITFDRSIAVGNLGGTFKSGPNNHYIVTNSVSISNCNRVLSPIGDSTQYFNEGIGDTCRADTNLSFNMLGVGTPVDGNIHINAPVQEQPSVGIVENNLIAGVAGAMADVTCFQFNGATMDSAACLGQQQYSITYRNNIIIGYREQSYNGNQQPSAFYGLPPTIQDHNIFYGLRSNPSMSSTDFYADPLLTNEPNPLAPMPNEAVLDNFPTALSSSSPAKYAGAIVAALGADYLGNAHHNPPSMGAVEFGGTPALTVTTIAFTTPNPIVLAVGGSVTPTCTVTYSDSTTAPCATAGASFTNSASTLASVSPAGAVTGLLEGTGQITASIGGVLGTDSFTINSAPKPTVMSISFASPVSLLVGATAAPACIASYSDSSTTACATAGATFTSDAPTVATANSAGTLSAVAPGTGHLLATVGLVVGTDTFTITAPQPAVTTSIAIAQPQYGFNVLPGATRRIFAKVTNGSTNQVTWSVKSGSAQISAKSGSWVDITAGSSGSQCQIAGSSVSSATQFTVEAISVDDNSKKSDVTFNVCKPSVQISTVPSYRTLYANQTADIQSLIVGSVNDGVRWNMASQPTGGDGRLVDSTSRDAVFSATVPGRYTLTATSVADGNKTATSILYVTGHAMPYRVTRNMTEPVDCSVDPALLGTTYEVGPSQTYKRLKDVPTNKIIAGSTIRLHNEDTTGVHPTTFHEYIQLSQHVAPDQPVRLCGVPDAAGNLPIVDASNAVGRSDVTATAAGNGLLTVGGSTSGAAWPSYTGAQNIVVEGLHLRNARAGVSYTAPNGTAAVWQSSAACVRVGDGHNISIVGNDIDGCANGAVSVWNGTTWGGSSISHLWEGNYVHGNGTAGSAENHQMYLQGWGQVVQFNRIDGLSAGSNGANLKSRGVQDVIRYNYFGDGAARDMDLAEVQGAARYMSFGDFFQNNATSTQTTYSMDQLAAWQEAWNSHFAYGNIYLNGTSSAPIHFSYDQVAGETARKGSLYWYNNTFYKTACSGCASPLWTMFDTSAGDGSYLQQTEFQTVQAFNNLLWMDSLSSPAFQWNDFDAFIGFGGANLLPAGWGANTLQGSIGDGWNALANPAAYQNAGSLGLHISGFAGSNVETSSTIPFDKVSWTLSKATPGTATLPTRACEMPTRFNYLPTLGYAVPRTASLNIGATDTPAQTAAIINLVGGSQRVNSQSSTCH